MGHFEKYLHAADDLSPLLRTGLLHLQLETIHPCLDGNGRIGRLRITRLLEQIPRHPIVSIGSVTRVLRTTKPTAAKAVSVLVDLGVLGEMTRRKRDRTFGYTAYLSQLRAGTEP